MNHLSHTAVEMCVAAPPNVARAIQNFFCPQLQNDVGVRADKNASGCDITKHRIENGPVPSTFDGIDPYQNAVNPHELVVERPRKNHRDILQAQRESAWRQKP